ncbi:MAG: glutamate 5-kinase [Albidovulum sp.]|nr:glutamate 5-kinase [Albidovulum sp.]
MDPGKPLISAKRIVVKIGSSLLVDDSTGHLNVGWLKGLTKDIADFKKKGLDILIVSSGAIALGRTTLRMDSRVLSVERSQAAAAVGQIRLARAYDLELAPHGIVTAQILLTLEDSENRRRYLNSRATLATLLAEGVVPIINENDTVATDEIRFGDNDRLAAQVAVMSGADVLVLLSDIDGLYSSDPRAHHDAKRLEIVRKITPDIQAMAGRAGTRMSKGGMKTKLLAAKTALSSGCAMAITNGYVERPLLALSRGSPCTWFLPERDSKTARKHWIASMKTRGTLYIDDGAEIALKSGKSLLPAGIWKTSGEFERGDSVDIVGPRDAPLGKGLVRYNFAEVEKILCKKTFEVGEILGYPARAAAVHRDDMVLD